MAPFLKNPPRANKYGAKPTIIDNIRFASRAEARRYQELVLLRMGGVVSELRCHVPYSLTIAGVHVCDYVSDFSYVENGAPVVEDVKGVLKGSAWRLFKIKKRLMLIVHGIDVRVVVMQASR